MHSGRALGVTEIAENVVEFKSGAQVHAAVAKTSLGWNANNARGFGQLCSFRPRAHPHPSPRSFCFIFSSFSSSARRSFARASIARLMQILENSVPLSPLQHLHRHDRSTCRFRFCGTAPPRFFLSGTAKPTARHRQLRPRKSARRFVTRNSSV